MPRLIAVVAMDPNRLIGRDGTLPWHLPEDLAFFKNKPCAEAYPAPRFLELAASAGIGLVISSDAHAPHEIARDFAKARDLAKAAGYRETQRFEKRKRTGEPCL